MTDHPALPLATDLAKRFEGKSATPYRDPVGYWTIGYGHLITHDRDAPAPIMKWSDDQAEDALAHDMSQFLAGVLRLSRPDLTPEQQAALTDFAYNVGLRSLRASTLLKLTNAGQIEAAAEQFARWKFAAGMVLPGLIRRRAAEAALFSGG